VFKSESNLKHLNNIDFENRLLTAHPEYQPMFPTIANVPAGELLNNAALKVSALNPTMKRDINLN
jgi:hypothetical protein